MMFNLVSKLPHNYSKQIIRFRMKLHSQLTQSLQEQERQQQQLLKTIRHEKAVAQFSKQKFMKKHLKSNTIAENININNNQSQVIKSEKQKVENLKTNLLVVLKNKNIDLDDRTQNLTQYPLSHFDQQTYQSVYSLNYLISTNFQSGVQLNSRCLIKHENSYTFVYGKVYGCNPDKTKLFFKYQDISREVKIAVPRIYLCFDDQNPYLYCSRFAKSYYSRISHDGEYKFSQTVKKMPTSYITKFNENQKLRIECQIKNKQSFQRQSIDLIFNEVEDDFKLAMNSLLFKKCSVEQKDGLLPYQFTVNHKKPSECPHFGLPEKNKNDRQIIVTKEGITMKQPKSLLQKFHTFCEQSLLISKQVVTSLQSIKSQCDEISDIQLFKIELIKVFNTKEAKQPFRFQHFQADQNVHNQKVLSKIKTLWVGNIRSVIQKQFRKGNVAWFNMNQKDRDIYQKSKTRRYFQQTRLIMQNTLLYLCKKSFSNYVLYVKRFIPEKVQILSSMHVINHYTDGYIIDSTKFQTYQRIRSKITLFQTDLMKNYDDSGFGLATPANNFMNLILNNFDKMLDELSKISDIESKCMIELFKKARGDKYLKTPNRFSNEQENRWIVELFMELKGALEQSIEPVMRYISQFDQFISVLKMKPDEYVKQIERQDEQKQKNIDELKQQVFSLYQKEKELTQKMPSCIRVSMFKIHLKEINEKLASKYNSTAKGLELMIAKKARKSCKNILEKYDEIKLKIKVKPKDIEKLMELKEYMNNISNELAVISKEVLQALSIYNVLDELKYVLPQEDLKKKYQMLLGPKEILEDAEKRKQELASKNLEFSDNLRIQQEEFKLTLEGRARTVAQFGMHSKKEQYKEIVEKVEIILDSLNKCQAQAKRINGREYLFEKNLTDYSKVSSICNEFMNYANYWLTLNEWIEKYSSKLLNSTLDHLNIVSTQKFVQESLKKLKDSSLFFGSKDLVVLSQNAELLKQQIDSFGNMLPILKVLKEMGTAEKNWSELSEKMDVKIIYNSLTLNKVKDFDFQSHLDLIKDIGVRNLKEQEEEVTVKTRSKQVSKLNDHFK